MQCLYPLKGWRSRRLNENGKRSIVFSPSEGYMDMEVTLPCSRCTNCRLKKSYETAIRCVHEASLHDHNHFVTLTYKKAPEDYSINIRHVQLFMKKLRRRLGANIKSYGCGEYGDLRGRPHYHLLLFNCPLSDLKETRRIRGNKYFESDSISKAWSNIEGCEPGFTLVGELNIQTAAYVARYVTKKFTNKDHGAVLQEYSYYDPKAQITYLREPERTIAVSQGIGKDWLKKWASDVYPADKVIMKGKEFKPPNYYDYRMAIDNEQLIEKVKRHRRYNAKEYAERPQPTQRSREVVAKKKMEKLVRRLEDIHE